MGIWEWDGLESHKCQELVMKIYQILLKIYFLAFYYGDVSKGDYSDATLCRKVTSL